MKVDGRCLYVRGRGSWRWGGEYFQVPEAQHTGRSPSNCLTRALIFGQLL